MWDLFAVKRGNRWVLLGKRRPPCLQFRGKYLTSNKLSPSKCAKAKPGLGERAITEKKPCTPPPRCRTLFCPTNPPFSTDSGQCLLSPAMGNGLGPWPPPLPNPKQKGRCVPWNLLHQEAQQDVASNEKAPPVFFCTNGPRVLSQRHTQKAFSNDHHDLQEEELLGTTAFAVVFFSRCDWELLGRFAGFLVSPAQSFPVAPPPMPTRDAVLSRRKLQTKALADIAGSSSLVLGSSVLVDPSNSDQLVLAGESFLFST